MRKIIFLLFVVLPILGRGDDWGFFAHQKINRLAIFTLPPEMIGFYKRNILYITSKSIIPDKRRYAVKDEASRHYIDVDVYGDSAVYTMPRNWDDAVEKYTEDTLVAYGIVPYHVNRVSYWLIEAFKHKDSDRILRLSTDLGHYIADANVPLHTTKNYNGQLSGQYGIHGFWESRLPELFFEQYDLLTGKAEYVPDIQQHIWEEAIVKSHEALDSVLKFEKTLSDKFSDSKKYVFEERGVQTVRTYSYSFSKAYHQRLNGMVENRLRASIKMVGDVWYSCWIKAGQPNLLELVDEEIHISDSTYLRKEGEKLRNHEAGTSSNL